MLVAGNGFSIQMNCQPAQGQNFVWHQYGFVFQPGGNGLSKIQYFINLWPTADYANTLNLPAGSIVDVYVTMVQDIPPDVVEGPCV